MQKSTKRLEEPQSGYYDVRDASRRQKHIHSVCGTKFWEIDLDRNFPH